MTTNINSKPLYTLLSVALLSASCAVAQAQQSATPPPPDGTAPPAAPITRVPPRAPRDARPRMDREGMGRESMGPRPGGMSPGARIAPPGMWWKSPRVIQDLALTDDQQKKMEDIFQKSRLQLIDLKANVEKQNVLLEPMLDANPPDTNKVLAQIDHVASARAELEKANARMLLGIRGVLTADQWTKLQAAERGHGMYKGPGGPGGGPDDRMHGRPGYHVMTPDGPPEAPENPPTP